MSNNRPAIPVEIRREVLFEARHHCAVCCNGLPLEQAHVVAWSTSREHTVQNLIALCANCHTRADTEKWGASVLRRYKQNPCIVARRTNAPEDTNAHLVQLLEILVKKEVAEMRLRSEELVSALTAYSSAAKTGEVVSIDPANSSKIVVKFPQEAAEKILAGFTKRDPMLAAFLDDFDLIDIRVLNLTDNSGADVRARRASPPSKIVTTSQVSAEASDTGSLDGSLATLHTQDTSAISYDETILFNRYKILRPAGYGGFAYVVIAQDMLLERQVALKLIPESVVGDRNAYERIRHQVEREITLTHPAIVRTNEFYVDQQGAAIVMEYIDGTSLDRLMARQPEGCFDPDRILPWLEQLCSALDYLHQEAHIVHRDLKPQKVLLDRSERIKLLGFGIARDLPRPGNLHSLGEISGTPAYMSPEQFEGEPPTILQDIYALGATIYALLTGKPPFFGGRVHQFFHQLVETVPPSIATRRDEFRIVGKSAVPLEWEETVAACLAKDPSNRPQSAGEVLARLRIRHTRE